MGEPDPSLQTTESGLVQRASGGDKEAFYLLVQPCEKLLFAAAMAILKNPEDAEEAAQEAVLRAFMNIGRSLSDAGCAGAGPRQKLGFWTAGICEGPGLVGVG